MITRADDAGDGENRSIAPIHTLTTKQRGIMEAIERYNDATGEPAPGAWLGRRFNLHPSTIQRHLYLLHRKGWLRTPNAPAVSNRPSRSTDPLK